MRPFLFFLIISLNQTILFSQIIVPPNNSNSSSGCVGFNFGCNCEPQINLTIHNGLAGYSGGQEIPESLEETQGAVTVANKNDTDGDYLVDNSADDLNITATPIGRNEIDLMLLEITANGNIDGCGATEVTLEAIGSINFWETSKKETKITNLSFPLSSLPKPIWIEATKESIELQDIEIKAMYNEDVEDIVKATAVWVRKTSNWRVREGGISVEDNPDPIADLPNLSNNLSGMILYNNIIPARRSYDGSRYGHGTNEEISETTDKRFGGRILFEFQVMPPDAGELVEFDVTRQIKSYAYRTNSGGVLPNSTSDFNLFPWEEDMDNEFANDDGNNNDEANVPYQNTIYSWDAPSDITDLGTDFTSFLVKRITFKEFVRVKIKNSPFDTGGGLQGSRASNKYDWHCVYYLKRGADGILVPDEGNVSYSEPVFSGGGNGNINISLDGNASTEGYILRYDSFEGVWKMIERSACAGAINFNCDSDCPCIESNSLTNGIWTINATGGNITISQGNIPFLHDDQYSFSVFKTSEVKDNVTNIGSYPVEDNP